MTAAAPFLSSTMELEQNWIDYNGHMNMAFYNLVFDQCLDFVFDQLGIGAAYVKTEGGSCFTREIHVNYLAELSLGDPIRVTFQLLDWDAKRLHYFEEMYHAEEGYLYLDAIEMTDPQIEYVCGRIREVLLA